MLFQNILHSQSIVRSYHVNTKRTYGTTCARLNEHTLCIHHFQFAQGSLLEAFSCQYKVIPLSANAYSGPTTVAEMQFPFLPLRCNLIRSGNPPVKIDMLVSENRWVQFCMICMSSCVSFDDPIRGNGQTRPNGAKSTNYKKHSRNNVDVTVQSTSLYVPNSSNTISTK